LKQVDILARVRGNLTAKIWKEKWGMHRPPEEGNFCDEHRKLKNLSWMKTTFSTWATSTEGTEQLIGIQLVRQQWSGQKN
jgi:hypothetical protein